MKNAIIYLLVFIALNLIGGFVVENVWGLVNGGQPAAKLITATAATSVLVIVVFLLARWAEVSPRWLRTRPWAVLFWCVIAALGAIIPSQWMQEQLPPLPNLMEDEFEMILSDRWGYLSLGLLAPLSEELVLRGTVLKSLLGSPKLGTFGAIALSALFFALIHFNPVQMPHAFIAGLLLGWMYWRTGSILPGVAFHWANNTVAYVAYNFYPVPDMKLVDLFGSQRTVIAAVMFSLLILLPALYQLNLRLRKAE